MVPPEDTHESARLSALHPSLRDLGAAAISLMQASEDWRPDVGVHALDFLVGVSAYIKACQPELGDGKCTDSFTPGKALTTLEGNPYPFTNMALTFRGRRVAVEDYRASVLDVDFYGGPMKATAVSVRVKAEPQQQGGEYVWNLYVAAGGKLLHGTGAAASFESLGNLGLALSTHYQQLAATA